MAGGASAAARGIPAEALAFYAGLEADNSRAYWDANREIFESAVRAPLEALLATMPKRLQPWHVFRPYRDVRFSKNKSPFKTMLGAASETEGGGTYYMHVSSRGLLAAAGMYMLAPDQLQRFRAAVADDRTGRGLQQRIDALRDAGLRVDGGYAQPLRSAPRGYPKDSPRIELLRWKGCAVTAEVTSRTVLGSPRLRERVLEVFETSRPLVQWLEKHVGPSMLPRGRR